LALTHVTDHGSECDEALWGLGRVQIATVKGHCIEIVRIESEVYSFEVEHDADEE
jgi:hypothetical protein